MSYNPARAHLPMSSAGRVRVLRIIARLNVGGPAIHAILLTERLAPSRFDCALVAGEIEPAESSYVALRGRPVDRCIALPELGREIRPWGDAVALRQLVRLIRERRPHIVHTHTAKAGLLGRTAAWMCRVPIVVHTFHGHVLHGYFSRPKSRLFVALERGLARVTDQLVAVSPRVRAELLGLGVGRPDRFSVIPVGLDLERFEHSERFRGEFRRELGLRADTPLVGIVARLVPIKGHEVFLRAAREIGAARSDAHFVIVGDGERRTELEHLARDLGLSNRVVFLGWRHDLDRIYADLDVVVLTSRNEGSPVALIEAMAAGRAVVSTCVGGVPDVVEDGRTGRLVGVDDAAAMADRIRTLLDDPGMRRQLGCAARTHALSAHGSERLLADVEALYSRLLVERHVTP